MRAARVIGWAFASVIALGSPLAQADNIKGQCIKANTDAQSFRREGKLAEARERLRMCSSEKCPALVSADCIKRLDELESVQPTVVFSVVDGQGRDLNDVKVTLDGRDFLDRLEGVAVDADLGEHELTFSAPGRAPVTQKMVFREGEKARLVRVVLEGAKSAESPENARAAAASTGPSEQTTPPSTSTAPAATAEGIQELPRDDAAPGRSSRQTIGYIVGGIGLAGLAVGGVFGYRTIQDKNRQTDNCESATSCRDYAKAAEAHEDAKSDGLISTVALIAGAATTAVGIVLLLPGRSQHDSAAPTALKLSPGFGRNAAGLWISGDI